MSLPEQPSPFRTPAPAERPWRWRFEDRSGAEVAVDPEHAEARFTSQGDAESWVGEVWQELLAGGVDAVTLLEADREVYGPMSLHPPA